MKVLIISYNPLTLNNNGGKFFTSLFSEFDVSEKCQLFIYDTLPDKKRCCSYYRITDNDVVKMLIGGSKNHELGPSELLVPSKHCTQQSIVNPQKGRALKLIVRDVLWKLVPWKRSVSKWIEKEKPDYIVSDTGDSCFLYSISMWASKKYNLPMVGIFGDDYYSIQVPFVRPIEYIQMELLKRKIFSFIDKCDKIVTLNHKFTKYYQKEFGEDNKSKYMTIYMGATLDLGYLKYQNGGCLGESKRLSYIGNLSLGRMDVLKELGEALDVINTEFGLNHRMYIYAKVNNDVKKCFFNIDSVVLGGFIDPIDIPDIIDESNILVHVESFKKEYVEKTKFSVSTKIADYLSSKRCLLAYGPDTIASMEHLLENRAAYCICKQSDLSDSLNRLLNNDMMIESFAHKGYECYKKYHESSNNSKKLKALFVDNI